MTLNQSALVALVSALAIVVGIGLLAGLAYALIAAGAMGLAGVAVFYDPKKAKASRTSP